MMCVMKRSSIKTKRISDENKSAKTRVQKFGILFDAHFLRDTHFEMCTTDIYFN